MVAFSPLWTYHCGPGVYVFNDYTGQTTAQVVEIVYPYPSATIAVCFPEVEVAIPEDVWEEKEERGQRISPSWEKDFPLTAAEIISRKTKAQAVTVRPHPPFG